MTPIVTPAEMAEIDAAAPEGVDTLIERAGAAVARAALRRLSGGYGKRVVVIAGKGNNGNDGRSAARRLSRRGVRCVVVSPTDLIPPSLLGAGGADLVIDAAYGTGFVDRGGWHPPAMGDVPVLAVDIPSGVSGLTGAASAGVAAAEVTVTFAALKPGLLLYPGRGLAGTVEVADIGLDCSRAQAWLVDGPTVAAWLTPRAVDAHKWRAACWLIAGSPAMPGAAALAARGCLRAGAGYVRWSAPATTAGEVGAARETRDPRDQALGWDPRVARPSSMPVEAVAAPLPSAGWAERALSDADLGAGRIAAAVIGPGLGRSADGDVEIRRFVAACPIPLVVDGDGLSALGPRAADILGSRPAPTVLTPHDGEFERLAGHRPGPDRFAEALGLAAATGAIVLLKGPTTIVASPDGTALVSMSGDARLATAGTGDVLAGIVGALLARGLDGARAAAAGAYLHGAAASVGPARGLVASDLPDLLPVALAGCGAGPA